MSILGARYISPTGEKKIMDAKKIIKEKGGGNVLLLIERGLKKISGNENKLSKIMTDIFFFLYVAASRGTTAFKPYPKSTLWVAKMYAATWVL